MAEGDLREAPQATVGSRLRAAREAAGLSVEQVSAATCIRVPLVHDLEADRFASSGGAVYARGHLRALARAAGVDPCPLVQAFDAQVGVSAPQLSHPVPVPSPRAASGGLAVPLSAPPERRTPRWAAAGVAGLAVLVGLLAVGTLGEEPAETVEATVEASAQPVAATAVKPKPKPAVRRPTGALLGLRATGRSWVSVTAAGKPLFEGTVEAGWARRFTDAAQVRVRLGNAAAVRVSCGGGTGAPAGTEGAVLTLLCTPTGLARP